MGSSEEFVKLDEGVYSSIHRFGLVDWHQWHPEVVEKARNENKLLFVHIGYIACHWCINMTSTSFEQNGEVAGFINENFIPVLIDKDERPDLVRYYSNIVKEVSLPTSWPFFCFTLYDGTPVFGATGLAPEHLLDIAKSIHNSFTSDPLSVFEIARDLSDSFSPFNIPLKDDGCSFSEKDIHVIVELWKRKFDKNNGGTLYPPKYPLVSGKEFLLEYICYYKDEEVLDHVKLTLEKMANGGIYDHINGGFFHYTSDIAWQYPFFEKQLVDNAALVDLYAKAQQYMPSPLYKKVIEETLQFCMRHLLAIDGGFHTSMQADPMGREPVFYTWSLSELKEVLNEDAELALEYYGLKPYNEESDRNVLYVKTSKEELGQKFGLTQDKVSSRLEQIKVLINQAFNSRTAVVPDDKVVTSINAIVANAFISAYRVTGYEEYFLFANETLSYIKSHLMTKEGKLSHFIRNGKIEGSGFLDDYAFTINAFINMYFIDGEEQWLLDAKLLADYTIANFFEPEVKMFLYCERIAKYFKTQTMPVADGVVSSASSVMLHCLTTLSLLFEQDDYRKKVEQAMCNIKDQLPGAGPYCANWARLLFYLIKPYHFVVIAGVDSEKIATKYFSYYYPSAHLFFIKKKSAIPLFKNITLSPDDTEIYLYVNGCLEKKSTDINCINQFLHVS